MNKELQPRVFNVPQAILDKIRPHVTSLNGQHVHGLNRANKLFADKTVTYGQLKRIIHDLQNMDKGTDLVKYNLAGGDLMLNWGKQFLQGERDIISNRKEGRKKADERTAMTGERKNSYLKKHSKKPDFLPPINMIKSNSHKSSIQPLKALKLTEEIEKIKKLIIY